jgi:L-malate glycosyltransferase
MKLLQLIQRPQPRGAETFAAQLSDNLNQQGYKSIIVAVFDNSESCKYKKPYKLLDSNPKARLFDLRGWRSLANIIKEEKPHIVQANAGDTLKYAVFSKIFFRWKQPIVFRNASTLSLYIKSPFQKIYNYLLLKYIDQIASVSDNSRQDLIKLFPKLNSKITTIPIGLENKVSVFNPFSSADKEQINLVHVGGFTFEKNHIGLLKIFKKLVETNTNVHLWLIGDGPLRNIIEAKIREFDFKDRVHCTGFVHNPLDYVSNAFALLLPSIIEGLPGVILEAMLYETPVVTYNAGGINELIKANKTGWIVENGNETAFVESVNAVLSLNEKERKQITDRAKGLVEQKYMNSHLAKDFIQLYERVLSKTNI